MKKTIAFLLPVLLLLNFFQGASQTCLIARDSIIAGNDVSSFSDYIYDVLNRIAQVTHTDSGSLQVNKSDAVYYDGNGNLSKIETYYTIGTPTLLQTIQYTYSSGKITRVDASGTDNGGWSISHDVSYNGNAISSIVVDPSSVTGSPEGFPGSFIDFVWQNGNAVSLSLLMGSDTIEVAASYDDKNNLYKKILSTDGAPSIFQTANANNITLVETVNAETIMGNPFPAGTALLDNDYTYNTNGDVETLTQNPALFDQDGSTTQYSYDCSVGIHAPDAVEVLRFYPNPAQDVVSLENGNFYGIVKIFDFAGKEILHRQLLQATSTIDIGELPHGVYFVEMNDGEKIFKGKMLVSR